MKKIKADKLADEIRELLSDYGEVTADILKDAVKKTADEVKKDISENAPKNTGKYAKSWTVTKVSEKSNSIQMVVRSKDRYQLTHLLEKGHAKRGGGRVEGIPHIADAEEKGQKIMESLIKKELKG